MFIRLIVLLIAMSSLAICKELQPVRSEIAPNLFFVNTEHGELLVKIKSPVYYLQNEKSHLEVGFFGTVLKKDGEMVKSAGGFYDTKPNPTQLEFDGGNECLEIVDGNPMQMLNFKKPGQAIVKFKFGNDKFAIPIKVANIEFEVGQKSDAIIAKLGFPTNVRKIFVEWPKSKDEDEIFYKPEAGQPINVEHWTFDKLPHLVVSVDSFSKNIREIAVFTPTETVIKEQLRWSNENKKRMELRIDQQEKIESEDEEKRQQLEELKEIRTWTAKNGKKFKAKFVKYSSKTVEFETEDKAKIKLKISLLSDEDAEIVKLLADSTK